MSPRVKQPVDQKALLAKIPPNAKRVYVLNKQYKAINEVASTDIIQTRKNGLPIVMCSPPGRLTNLQTKPQPTTPMVAELIKRKEAAIQNDPILGIVKNAPEDPDVLYEVIKSLCAEAASLGFERKEAERLGEKTSDISVRKVNTLKTIADTWLKRKDQIVSRGIDLNSPAFKALFKFLMETIQEAMDHCGVEPEMVETVFSKLTTVMDNAWESEAKNRMKGVV
jgi:hypothetical protein